MRHIWRVQPHDEARVQKVAAATGASPVLAQLLALRGLTDPNKVRCWLEAKLQDLRSGELLPGANQAAHEITQAISRNKKIVIYGDYDADGMTATAILVRCIELLGGKATYYVPNRLDDGYGLNEKALSRLASEGAELVITVDCGIASVEHAKTAKELGLRLIITDHHRFGTQLPDAVAIVHPGLPNANYPFHGLCGAGVALKLAWRVCQLVSGRQRVSPAHRNYLLMALGLAAIGTVADVVPLLDENRLIVRHGLAFLKQHAPPGLNALMKLTGLDQKPQLATDDIGFTIAPRLNAAGRLGQAQLGVELLTTHSQGRAEALAEYIHQLNDSRESLERKILTAANKQVRDQSLAEGPAIVLAERDWHPGVIGIVAGRLAEKYHRPTILIAQDETGNRPATGSARSACGVDLYAALQHCHDLLLSCGGHRQAAGLKIKDDNIDRFREEFCIFVEGQTSSEDLEPTLRIDAEVPLSHLTLQTLSELEKLAPFGQDNPRPMFCSCGIALAAPAQRMGGGERHLSLQLIQHDVKLRAVSFGNGEWAEQLNQLDQLYDFAFQPIINEFRGRRSVELRVVDWRLSEVTAALPASA